MGYPCGAGAAALLLQASLGTGVCRLVRAPARRLGRPPDIPLFLQFPAADRVPIPIPLIERLHRRAGRPGFAGSGPSGDLAFAATWRHDLPDLAVFPSSEVSLREAYRSGFAGCIGHRQSDGGALRQDMGRPEIPRLRNVGTALSRTRSETAIAGPHSRQSSISWPCEPANRMGKRRTAFYGTSNERKAVLSPTVE